MLLLHLQDTFYASWMSLIDGMQMFFCKFSVQFQITFTGDFSSQCKFVFCFSDNKIALFIFPALQTYCIYLFFKHIAVALENSIFFLASIPIMYKKYPLYFYECILFILAFITLGFLYPFCSRKSIKSFSVFI